MVKLSNCFLRTITLVVLVFCLNSCKQDSVLYERAYTEAEQLALSESLLNGAGTDLYYQGTVGERMIILEGNSYNKNNAWGQRELGVPYLKRGFAHEAELYYAEAIKADPEEWLGYKAYCWLYFYRDYERALADIDKFDALTPDFVDYPQSTSVNYMRGICYLQLGKYDESIDYLTQHLSKEVEDVGHKYIDAMPYLLLGVAYHKNGNYAGADSMYSLGLKHNESTSDLYYYKAQNAQSMGQLSNAKEGLQNAQEWYTKGAKNGRPYVEEFYAIYQEDLDELNEILNSNLEG